MSFTLAFCLSLVAAAAAQPAANSESTPDLDIRKMANVTETLVVLMRKHTNITNVRCQSAKRAVQLSETQYNYTLRARVKGGAHPDYVEENVTVTLERINGSENYRSTYTQDAINYTLTLKKMESKGDCFVIFVHKSDGKQGCELLVPLSKRNEKIPHDCNKYYKEKCQGTNLRLSKKECIYK